MQKLDLFNDYLTQTIEAGDFDMGDVGSLIALAILEAGTDYSGAIDALEKAKSAFSKTATVKEAAEAFDSAIHHLDVRLMDF